MPKLPDHMPLDRRADAAQPFRLVAAPSRQFLNSTFTEMPTSRKREQRPTALMHPDDMAQLGLADGDLVRLGNERGSVLRPRQGARRPAARRRSSSRASGRTATWAEGIGVNLLLSADPAPPNGGAVIHDTAVWLEPVIGPASRMRQGSKLPRPCGQTLRSRK